MSSSIKNNKDIKGLVLNLLNAKKLDAALDAFTYKQPKGHLFKRLKKVQYYAYVDAFKPKHPDLAGKIGNDEGIRLMYLDSQIMNNIIEKAITESVPILTVHDPVICREKDEPYVRTLMSSLERLSKAIHAHARQDSSDVLITASLFACHYPCSALGVDARMGCN